MPSELEQLLAGTSRTFAAAIPLLEAPLRDEVTVAYLLLRIADTFEDAEAWTPEARTQALLSFEESVVSGSSMPLVAPPGFDAAHQTLSQHLNSERDHFVKNLHHPNAGEGIAAFLEKRAPRYE